MKVERVPIDSQVLGRNVLAIQDLDPGLDFADFEADYLHAFNPVQAYCKVPLEQIGQVHHLERHGFHLIECQIRSMVKLRREFDLAPYHRYRFVLVTRAEDLGDVLELAGSTFAHDRWRVDPAVGPGLAAERYRRYVLNSFESPQESVYRLLDRETGQVVGFKTHRTLSDREVLFLLGGVHPDFKNTGLGLINEYFEFNQLIALGFRKGITHISAANYPVFNLEIGGLGFRVLTTFAVLRKVYP